MFNRLRSLASRIVAEVQAARAPAVEDDGIESYAIPTPGTHETITLPKTRVFDHPPTPEEARTEARRIAFAYAKERSGKPNLTWKQAKLLLDRWEKEERLADHRARKDFDRRVVQPNRVAMQSARR